MFSFLNFRGISTLFRVWYSKLFELKSLLTFSYYAIFTATAIKVTKMTLNDMLDLAPPDTFCVEKSPARSNICYICLQHLLYICYYVDNNLELETVFKELIDEVKQFKHETKRFVQPKNNVR